ncbi:MAG: type IV pilus assembly protein PilM [Actinomycetota bacterium]
MARSLLGLDIGTSAVRAAEVSMKTEPPTLTRFASAPLPRGAVVGGEIIDTDAVVSALREAIRRGRFQVRNTALGLANQKVVVRQIEMPAMEEEELKGALQFQAQEFIPIPIEDAILDFQILEEITNDAGERVLQILLVAAQKDMVNTFVSVAQRAGLDPSAVDLSSFAVLRALGSTTSILGAREGEALIDIGAAVTNIVVHEGSRPRFVRILPMGGDDVTEALATGLNVSWDEAETVKARIGVTPEGGPIPVEGAARLIEQRASAFIDEVRGSIDYYLTQPGAARIATVVATGGGSKLPGLAERLSAALHLPVEEAQPLSRLRLGKVDQTPDELALMGTVCSVSIGLAMREP